ncbi:MAG: hypothetical protein WAV50_00350 [Minisyncoccia bacterium]
MGIFERFRRPYAHEATKASDLELVPKTESPRFEDRGSIERGERRMKDLFIQLSGENAARLTPEDKKARQEEYEKLVTVLGASGVDVRRYHKPFQN